MALQFLTLPRVSRCSTPSPPSWPYRSARGSVLVSRERGTRTPLRALTEAPTPPAPSMRSASLDIVRIILAILLPPVGVFLQVGLGLHFWLNILLTIRSDERRVGKECGVDLGGRGNMKKK